MGLIARLVQVLVGVLNNGATRIFLMKMFVKSILVTCVPLVVFISFNSIFKAFVDFQIDQMNNMNVTIGSTALQLTGLASYLYSELGLGTGISMLVSAYGIVLLGRSIPFLR